MRRRLSGDPAARIRRFYMHAKGGLDSHFPLGVSTAQDIAVARAACMGVSAGHVG